VVRCPLDKRRWKAIYRDKLNLPLQDGQERLNEKAQSHTNGLAFSEELDKIIKQITNIFYEKSLPNICG
jgi:hypothetical protein